MGMTIDEAIEFFDGLEGHTPQAKDARNVAIDTMRKYQKIEKIIKNAGIFAFDVQEIRRIAEVMKDGDNKNSTNLDSN